MTVRPGPTGATAFVERQMVERVLEVKATHSGLDDTRRFPWGAGKLAELWEPGDADSARGAAGPPGPLGAAIV